jgi:hypothetical protein
VHEPAAAAYRAQEPGIEAVAGAEQYRARMGEARDEDDRWPGGEIEMITAGLRTLYLQRR